uniref:MobA/MobL family protein n=2 Tax=cellular organisms TaxID=131567 RepID=UPI001597C4A7|nr:MULTISPECIES: MobA/MobL family protein [Bacteria]QJS05553.1 mobilization protein MobL [Psychrobacter sp.]QJS05700.1 mobilization protein MobL [Psychrobacter sp.]QJS05846.1 mobilization protein MobA/MobL [Psychrobacter sp.]QJS06185.1 mobilization protein MobL [Planococcus sp. (in: firmicutes)]
MAIFMASTKSVSRAKGQSAIAAAAYRAGDKLLDEDKEHGKTHDYQKRSGVLSADIILPSALANSEIGRAELWNMAERNETRKNSRVAREWLIALPHELSEQDRKDLAHDFARTLADRYQVIADCAIHVPTDKEIERGASPLNFHAHILLTTRTATIDDDGKIVLTKDKADSEISDDDRRKKGLPRMSVEVKAVRELWELTANKVLEAKGHHLIDSRSYKSQGIDLVPQLKMGKDATHMERKGIPTEKGLFNREIIRSNELVWNKHLDDNQKINTKADRTIADLSESKLFIVPTAPKPDFKQRKVTKESIDSTNDAVNKLKTIRLNREKAHQAEQERLRQQQIAAIAQKKQEQADQEKLEREQRREQTRERIAMETRQFNQHFKRLAQQLIKFDKPHLKKIDPDSEFGQHLVAIVAADTLMRDLKSYQREPSTTKHQRELAEIQYERLGNTLIVQSQSALDSSKSTRHSVTQKEYTAALKGTFDAIVPEHKQNLSQTQQERLQSVSAAINDHSYDINRSRGMTLGF